MATRKSRKHKKLSKATDENASMNYTLNDSYWMDSFDKIVENVKRPLRERNIFKRNVRVSYNRDSSLENATSDDEGAVGGDIIVVESTPRFKGKAPKKSYAKPSKTSSSQLQLPTLLPPPPPPSKDNDMFFNFVSTPANRKTDQMLNLSAIMSSEGEPSLWQRISFKNISKFLQKKRRSEASPVPGEESRKMLKTPEKEDAKKEQKKKATRSSSQRQTKTRKSEKPRVLFNLVNEETDDEDENGKEKKTAGRMTEDNFVLKPGKWRKSIANIRRTMNAAGPPTGQKLSVMFDLPAEEEEKTAPDEKNRLTTGAGRWTRGPRLSQFHPGRRRKSIFIPQHVDSIMVVDEVDEAGLNESRDELLAHHSDDDRDPGPRKPKSSGFFGNLATRTSQNCGRGFGKRSIPVPLKSAATGAKARQQLVDAEFIDRLSEQLSLSGRGGAGTGATRADRKKTVDQLALLNDSSVQLLLHDENEEDEEGKSRTSSCSVSSDEGVKDDDSSHLVVVVEDLVVGSKFARQLSKSHSVLVEEVTGGGGGNQDIFQLGESIVLEGPEEEDDVIVDSTEDEDASDAEEEEKQRQQRKRGTKSVGLVLPESPTRFCFVDGTNQVSVRDTVLKYCDQSEPLRFADVYSERVLRQCRKVGEGVYSEVFMYRQFDEGNNKSSAANEGKAIVLKVIPIEGELIVNGEVQKKFDEILSEIIISKELSDLRYDTRNKTNGFVNVERVRCVKGRYPSYLVDLWDLYNENHGSDNDHPEVFGEEQLFIVLELENAGQDLEAFNFHNAVQGYAAFLQTVLTLAVAESKYEFEHRDLHWGNILLRHTDEREAHFMLNGQRITVPTEGVQVTIIDYTLSRMLYKRHYLQFNDLAHDEDLFSATGDYQYEIYRLMRKRLGNVWSSFEPYTNVLWLHYMIDKLINGARYRLKQSKKHKSAIKQMMTLRDEVPDYKSAADLAKLFAF